MSLLDRILQHSANARVPRALDPETHKPYPRAKEPGMAVKAGAALAKTDWAKRVVMRWVAAATGTLSTWLLAHGGGDNTAGMIVGATSLLLFVFEQVVSWLCNYAKIDPPPAIPHANSFSPFGPAEAVQRADRSIVQRLTEVHNLQRREHGLPGETLGEVTPRSVLPPALNFAPEPPRIYTVRVCKAGEDAWENEFSTLSEAIAFRDRHRMKPATRAILVTP